MNRFSHSCFKSFTGILLAACVSLPVAADNSGPLIEQALSGEHRNADNKARDEYRHPRETLEFFGLEADMRVLEITPGGGWYTEVLAPVLKNEGELIVASFGSDHPVNYLAKVHDRYMQKLDSDPASYADVRRILFKEDGEYLDALADESVDMVVTFRNSHNWIKDGEAEAIYEAMHRVLKPCGILGVVQHRAEADADPVASARQGYVPEPYMLKLVGGAGFEFSASSEINANPEDSRDHEDGVWSLPPTFRSGDSNREKYEAIGESDRMTLRFVKPGAGKSCPDA